MYTDSNQRNTLGYEWPLTRCNHVIVCIYLMVDGWFRGLLLYFEDDVDYFVDVLILLHVLVYRFKHNTLLN
jgi:hypothetical protein